MNLETLRADTQTEIAALVQPVPTTSAPLVHAAADDPLWYKDAVIYQTHVKAFFDANNDGVGDFAGLIQKLGYIQELGVSTLWLLPFYPSPLRDDGYDIADYRSVNPAYGTLKDFRRLVQEAHRRGIRVVTELVINHTSDQHAWFQRARRAKPGSRWRDYYVWSDTDQKYKDTRIIFLDTEKSNWTWDPEAKAYFWHRFYSHQPDLNFDNPRVLREVLNVLHYWAEMGVDGFRLDAIPYLIEREGTNCENLPETHQILKRIRAELEAHFKNRMLLAEANQWPEDTYPYFGNGDECHMAFHFPLMPRMYMAIAQEDRHPITDIMRQTPEIPETCQWAIFLRNHDELTLEMVTQNEREYLWNTYAADRRMRINLGIRRRLAPLMDNDRRKIELMNALLFSMPGTPVIYYGDEIGMGDNIYLGDRDGVRTPMQWSPDRNGGFPLAEAGQLSVYHEPAPEPLPEFITVVLHDTWRTVIGSRGARELAEQVLPEYLPKQRWFAAKDRRVQGVRLASAAELKGQGTTYLLAELEVALEGTAPQRYLLPFAVTWGEENLAAGGPLSPYTLAKARRGPRVGALHDATWADGFARTLVRLMHDEGSLPAGEAAVRARAGNRREELAIGDEAPVRRLGAEQSNTSLLVDERVMLKVYRRLHPGIHPEIEIGRFLTDAAGFAHTPPLLGTLERVEPGGEATALAAAFGFVANQGDGWRWTLDHLDRALEELRPIPEASRPPTAEVHELYLAVAQLLGRRTAELHRAFAIPTEDPAFAAEPVAEGDLAGWLEEARAEVEKGFGILREAAAGAAEPLQGEIEAALALRPAVEAVLAGLERVPEGLAKTRLHGDYHLGQVLVAKGDIMILDFEGEPARPLAERRAKSSPLKDVAGMLRSFDYAAWASVLRFAESDPGALDTLLGPALAWRDTARAAFLDEYHATIGDCPSWPAEAAEAEALLRLFVVQKLFYEVGYEAANRPGWLRIPVRGILEAFGNAGPEQEIGGEASAG